MTKEELEKEAEEWLCNNLHSASEEDFIKAMIDIAEPREKRIEELEGICKDLSYKFDYQVKQVMKLEKENAELKKKLKPENCLKLLAKEGYIKFTSEQLTKAKDIIKKYYKYNPSCEYFYEDIDKEAEQFLNEVEK